MKSNTLYNLLKLVTILDADKDEILIKCKINKTKTGLFLNVFVRLQLDYASDSMEFMLDDLRTEIIDIPYIKNDIAIKTLTQLKVEILEKYKEFYQL